MNPLTINNYTQKKIKVSFYSKLRAVAYINILTVQMSFFSILAVLGLSYGGSGESSLYIYVLIASSVVCYIFLFMDLIMYRYINKHSLFLLGIPFLVILVYIISGVFTEFTNKTMSIFILLVMPSMLVGYVLAVKREITILRRGFVYVSLLIALGIFSSLNLLITAGHTELSTVFGGGQYQALSYFSSFGYSALLVNFLFFRKKKSILISALYLIIFTVLILGVVFSGGRGGAVVVIVSTLVLTIIKFGYKSSILKVLLIVTSTILILILIQDYDIFDRIMRGGSRLFSYISKGGIDVSQSSNRDIVWEHSLFHIKENWLFGYGPFSYEKALGDSFYPHNLFLDFLLHGGVLYLLLWANILVRHFKKIRKIIKINIKEVIVLIPFLNSFILLMFSGTYLQEGLFWFSIMYVFSLNLKKVNNKLQINTLNENIGSNFRVPEP